MKKRLSLLLWLLIGYGLEPCFSQGLQLVPFGNNIHFNFIATNKNTMIRQTVGYSAADTAIYRVISFKKYPIYTDFVDVIPNTPVMLGVKLDPALTNYSLAPLKSFSKEYASYMISNNSDAMVVALGITKDNIKDYRYHVIENDSVEVVPWSKIPKLEQQYGARQPYGFVGRFNAPGKQLMVEIVNIKDYKIRDGVIFDWRANLAPTVTGILIYRPVDLSYFKPFNPEYFYNNPTSFNLNFIKKNHGYATQFDAATGLPLDFKFPIDSVTTIQLNLKDHETIPYKIFLLKTDEKTSTDLLENNLLGNKFDINLASCSPGNYKILVQKKQPLGYADKNLEVSIPFIILPPPGEKYISIIAALPYIIAAFISVVLLFWGYRRRTNIKLAGAVQARQIMSLKLRAITAQLNPHFMFNALTSIQNLVNKNDIEKANRYLSKFADLTRKVLDTGEQELISLEDEINILDDYLQMEQLRFNFKYQFKIDESINIANTEIPAMLLQPFVENAVKHGVANMREKGLIKISISQNNKNLVLSIIDNGPGFKNNKDKHKRSFGLKLSEERRALLNQIYKEQQVFLNILNSNPGTTIIITLTNWLS